MEITTKRFLLREFTDEDGPAFLAYQSDPRYAQRAFDSGLLRTFGEGCPKGLVIWAVIQLSQFRGYHSDHFFNSTR